MSAVYILNFKRYYVLYLTLIYIYSSVIGDTLCIDKRNAHLLYIVVHLYPLHTSVFISFRASITELTIYGTRIRCIWYTCSSRQK